MTKISDYRLNTRFTALKQLTDLYETQMSFSSRTIASGSHDIELSRASISVPAGAYVETPVISSSFDNYIYHLAHGYTQRISNDSAGSCYVFISLEQSQANEYTLIARASNSTSTSSTIPRATVKAYLRLAIAPFDV